MHPAPVRDKLLDLLRQGDNDIGVTTAEIAERMGRNSVYINCYLSKLQQYGYVRKISGDASSAQLPHELNRWKLP